MRQRQIEANNFRLRSIDKARSKLSYPDLGDPDFFRSPSIEEKWQQLEQEKQERQGLINSIKRHLSAKKTRINKILGDRPPDWDGSIRPPGKEPDYPLFSKGSEDSAPVALGGRTPADLKGGKQKPAPNLVSIDKIQVPSPIEPWEKSLNSGSDLDLSVSPKFSLSAAKTAAAFSVLAYESEGKVSEWLSSNGFKPVLTKKDPSGKEKKGFVGEESFGTDFIVASRPNKDGSSSEYVISVRGTEGLDDWARNANLLKNEVGLLEKKFKGAFGVTVPELKGAVHAGYYAAALKILNDLPPEMMQAVTTGNKSNLTITGHSLGGGVGTILTAMMSEMGAKSNMQTYTFGAPAVGDKKFVEKYNKLNVQRITAKGDVVPHLTTAARALLVLPRLSAPGGGRTLVKEISQGGFRHIGTERRIDTPDIAKGVVGKALESHAMKDNYFKNIYKKNDEWKPVP